jgi:phosphoribosyl 1,2-cyclic phosphate phosphodiesterase
LPLDTPNSQLGTRNTLLFTMKITFLGTGTSQGVPVIACGCEVCKSLDFRDKRLRVSIHIEVDGKSIIIDSGPDFRQQMLRERISVVNAILITHEHKDHTAGLDDVRAFNFAQNKDMPVYARKQVLNQIRQEFSYAFAPVKYPGVPVISLYEVEGIPFDIEGIAIVPIEVLHYKLPVFGYRIGNFTYITDVKYISDESLALIQGSEVIVLGALQRSEHISHFTLDEAVAVLQKLNPSRAYITHLSHKMGQHREVEAELPPFIRLAYDGLKIEL